jgi:beta-lactamase superfamily II metal-dependent hydrolase
MACSNFDENDNALAIKYYPDRIADFSLWQSGAFFGEVQMGYIIKTDDNKLIVIDGGGKLAAPILENYLRQFGGKVDTWILTHPHSDHVGALLEILDKGDIEIKQIMHVPLPNAWAQKNEPKNLDIVARYNQEIGAFKGNVISVSVGDKFELAEGVQMQVFGGLNERIVTNAINNSSMVFKITAKSKSVLFLGDLGLEGGGVILNLFSADQLKADYVQMAHHGQNGVDKAFYQAVGAKYALWPTPEWLWENRAEGKEFNSGIYKTLTVRRWMDELKIKRNYVSGLEGTVQID